VIDIWAAPGGFQELDTDVAATLVRRVNYYYFYGNIPAGEALGADTFPNSLYLSGKPGWFHSLAWPPFDPRSPGTPAYVQIPAGYRYVNGVDPPDSGSPSGGGFMLWSRNTEKHRGMIDVRKSVLAFVDKVFTDRSKSVK
jgi:hypothetical protein